MASKREKICSDTLHSSDLSLGIHFICSQSCDTIPLSKLQSELSVLEEYVMLGLQETQRKKTTD
jgi:hypothetical protein